MEEIKKESLEKMDRNSSISQIIDVFSSRINKAFRKSPKIIDLFRRKWRLDKCENPDRVKEITINGDYYTEIVTSMQLEKLRRIKI